MFSENMFGRTLRHRQHLHVQDPAGHTQAPADLVHPGCGPGIGRSEIRVQSEQRRREVFRVYKLWRLHRHCGRVGARRRRCVFRVRFAPADGPLEHLQQRTDSVVVDSAGRHGGARVL